MAEADKAADRLDASRFKSIIELTSFLGSIGFVTSALINEFVFRQWGLSYLAICSIQDVVLGGVQLLILAILSLPLILMALIMLAMISSSVSALWRAGLRWRLLVSPAALLLLVIALSWWLPPSRIGLLPWATVAFVPALLIWMISQALISATAPRADWRDAWTGSHRYIDNHRRKAGFVLVVLITALAATLIYQAMSRDLAQGRGTLLKTPELPATLAAHCTGRDVVWIGSDRVLVRCAGTYVVLQDKAGTDIILASRAHPFFASGR